MAAYVYLEVSLFSHHMIHAFYVLYPPAMPKQEHYNLFGGHKAALCKHKSSHSINVGIRIIDDI